MVFNRAAEHNYPHAQFNIAICYLNGDGIEKSNKKAVFLFSQPAEQGENYSQLKLAKIYQKGEIVTKSHPLAIY